MRKILRPFAGLLNEGQKKEIDTQLSRDENLSGLAEVGLLILVTSGDLQRGEGR